MALIAAAKTSPAPMPPEGGAGEEAAESVSVPVSMLGGAAVGDTVTFTVKSIDGDNAQLEVAEATEPAEAEGTTPEPSTVSKAAALFGEGGE